MVQTIAHEIVHEWIPWPSISHERWLTEGFTEHVAQLILMSSGVGDTRWYANEFNQSSWGHRGGTHPAERTVRFPYEVGFLLAHHWRTEQSDPKRVDALLRGLVDRDVNGRELESAIVEYLGPRAWQDVVRHVHDKKPIPDPVTTECFDVMLLTQETSHASVRYPVLRERAPSCALFDFD